MILLHLLPFCLLSRLEDLNVPAPLSEHIVPQRFGFVFFKFILLKYS